MSNRSHRRSTKVSQKTSVNQHKVKKKFNYSDKDYEDVGSLVFVMDSKEEKKINELDKRMEHLKSELKSLFNDPKLLKSEENSIPDSESDKTTCSSFVHSDEPITVNPEFKNNEIYDIEVNDFEPKMKCLPPFTDCLDKSIDEITISSQNQKEFSQSENLHLNFTSQKALPLDKSVDEHSFKSKFLNSSIFSPETVEELLFKSFYLQILGINLYSSGMGSTPQIKSNNQLKHHRPKCRKSLKKIDRDKFHQSNLVDYCESSSIRKKRKKINCDSPSESNVEVIDLDNYSEPINCLRKEQKTIECSELNLTDYDWNEPFDLEEKTQFHSDVEIVENISEQNSDLDTVELNTRSPESLKSDSLALDESREVQSKTGWECPICFEKSKGQEIVATFCGHIFCKKCLYNYHSKCNKTCPTCRTDLTNKEPITLFNL